MESYRFHWVDAYENVKGEIEAYDAAHAALLVLGECGTEPNRPRFSRYGIRERSITKCGRDVELVIFSRLNEYFLEIKKSGSRKRKPLSLYA